MSSVETVSELELSSFGNEIMRDIIKTLREHEKWMQRLIDDTKINLISINESQSSTKTLFTEVKQKTFQIKRRTLTYT